jgi:hypothetical protein
MHNNDIIKHGWRAPLSNRGYQKGDSLHLSSEQPIFLWQAVSLTPRAGMVLFLASLLLRRLLLRAFGSKGAVISENTVLMKENAIQLRRVGRTRVHFSFYDRSFFVVPNRAADINTQRPHQGSCFATTRNPSSCELCSGWNASR